MFCFVSISTCLLGQAALVTHITSQFPGQLVFDIGLGEGNASGGLEVAGFGGFCSQSICDILIDLDRDGNNDVLITGISANTMIAVPLGGSEFVTWFLPKGTPLGGGVVTGDENNYGIPASRFDILGPDTVELRNASEGWAPGLGWKGQDSAQLYSASGGLVGGGVEVSGFFTSQSDYPFLQVRLPGESEGDWHYAWVSIFPLRDGSGFVPGWGYETEPNVPIVVGAFSIPEPSTGMLLGLCCLVLVRRRR